MVLYKYMPTDRFFDNLRFRFTPAEDLNDPRELVPDIRLKNPGRYVEDIVLRNVESAYFRFLLENPGTPKEEAFHRCLAAAEEYVASFDHAGKINEIFDKFMRVTNKIVGVLSLTDTPNNELMWAHYANSHDGFAVGLDPDSGFFQPKAGEPHLCGELMNVQYSDTRPVVFVDPGKLDIPKEIFFTKTTKWSYENEWRMIKKLEMADQVIEVSGKKIHLFEVPSDAIKEVIFGTKVTPEKRAEVEDKLRHRCSHIVFKQARFDAKKNELIIE